MKFNKRFRLMLLLMVILILVYPVKTLFFDTAVDQLPELGDPTALELEVEIPANEVGYDYQVTTQ